MDNMNSKNSNISKSLIKRLAVIDREVGEKRFPNRERLAKRLGVSSKTIQRDIEFLKFHYNAPIDFDKNRMGFFYTDPSFRLNPLKIDSSDFLGIAVTEKVLAQYNNTPYSKYFQNFFRKLDNMLEGKLSVDLKDIDKIMSFYIGPVRSVDENIMRIVEIGLRESRRIQIDYLTGWSGKESERDLDIYHLKNFQGDWYAIGYCLKSKQIKVFSVSRIKKIRLTNIHFEIPDKFSIEDYFKDSFGIFESDKLYNIKLRFTSNGARYIKEKVWHKSQVITENYDGSINMDLTVNNLNEILTWVLSMGRECKVIQPKELKTMVRDELEATIVNYE